MIALIWTLITTVVSVAVGYTIFLIAQKIVHFFGRASGVAAYKLHEKLQKPETKDPRTWAEDPALMTPGRGSLKNEK